MERSICSNSMSGAFLALTSGYCSSYPPQRTKKGKDDVLEGVAGTLGLLQTASVSEQPVNAFDWSPDKMGLCAFTSYDQTVRVGIVTKLNKI